MKIAVLIPNEKYLDQAGARIRYRRIEAALKSAGHEFDIIPICALASRDDFSHDVYVISKVYDARSFAAAEIIVAKGKRFGIDLFDDYFTQTERSEFTRLRYWLQTLASRATFILCATDAMSRAIARIFPDIPTHVLNDPSLPLDVESVQESLRSKLAVARHNRKISLAWFGIGDNRYFPVGLADLVAFGGELARFQNTTWDVQLHILTNRRALTRDMLSALRRLPLTYHITEWTEQREAQLLDESIACFLPVNGQNFSVVKSLNRAVSALGRGVQVISAGYPLYKTLSSYIYDDAGALVRDLERGTLRLNSDNAPEMVDLLGEHADAENEAGRFIAFLGDLKTGTTADSQDRSRPFAAVIHGRKPNGDIHRFFQRLQGLSISTPFSAQSLNFDIRILILEGGKDLEIQVAKKTLSQINSLDRNLFSRTISIKNRPYYLLNTKDMKSMITNNDYHFKEILGVISVAANYSEVCEIVGYTVRKLFPNIPIYVSEENVPFFPLLDFFCRNREASMTRPHAVFLINLLQDVNIIRPLVYMASRDLGLPTILLISHRFVKRDELSIWQQELNNIAAAVGAQKLFYADEFDAFEILAGKGGVIVAASESDLAAHSTTSDVFRVAPSTFVKVTLQHGYECVGFLQSREHDLAHGVSVTFNADVVCGWCSSEMLTSMHPSQRSKLYVSGPPSVLQMQRQSARADQAATGLVCENMHSVRLHVSGNFRTSFISTFEKFCGFLQQRGNKVTLRPHPGGQYFRKNGVSIPRNVTVNNLPMYKVNLGRFAYGISAPSSVLIDMMLAGIPVAVWRDEQGVMDADNYAGLAEVSSAAQWLEFSQKAIKDPAHFLERQQAFLETRGMPTDPADVYGRFARLFSAAIGLSATRLPAVHSPVRESLAPAQHERVMFIANGLIPTLQLSFLKPLEPMRLSGDIAFDILPIEQMPDLVAAGKSTKKAQEILERRLAEFAPTLLVFCRYSAAHAEHLVAWARERDLPVIFHVDDDLLNIPIEIGEKKFKAHTHPNRLRTVRHLLENADLVYCSTKLLKERFRALGFKAPMLAGQIYCAGEVITPAQRKPARVVGYMGFDHTHDFNTILPAIVEFLRNNQHIVFEMFGSIPRPSEFAEFGDRVAEIPPVRDYQEFLKAFASRNWDIAICPLAKTDFNRVKANTKWVEYTSVGAAVIATSGMAYDDCCSDGCGILADTHEEWVAALETLSNDADARFAQVFRAQARLVEDYSVDRLRDQIKGMFAHARVRVPRKSRIMFVSPNHMPTLQLSFVKPLAKLIEAGNIEVDYISVQQMKELDEQTKAKSKARWVTQRLDDFEPDLLVACRYNGPASKLMIDWANRRKAPTIYHIDDDLLDIPSDIGDEKAAYHNSPDKRSSVLHWLNHSTLVYCSTKRLKTRLADYDIRSPIVAGEIYCAGKVIAPAAMRPVRRVGYMASADHVHNLPAVLPAIVDYLRLHPAVSFEFFGSIAVPSVLEEFGDRISTTPPVSNYENFLAEFALREWDIGICPLASIPFNLAKANTKWVEYTSVGAAVIASRGTVYDDCCADGAGILASGSEEWLAALNLLTSDPSERYAQVTRAQEKLQRVYSVERLTDQVIDIFDSAAELSDTKSMASTAPITRAPTSRPKQAHELL